MATVTIADENRTIHTEQEITALLASHGIDYERWNPAHPVADNAPAEEILNAYASEIEELKQRGGYVTACLAVVNEVHDFPSAAGEGVD